MFLTSCPVLLGFVCWVKVNTHRVLNCVKDTQVNLYVSNEATTKTLFTMSLQLPKVNEKLCETLLFEIE